MPPSSTLTVFSGLIQPYSFSLISKYQLTAFGVTFDESRSPVLTQRLVIALLFEDGLDAGAELAVRGSISQRLLSQHPTNKRLLLALWNTLKGSTEALHVSEPPHSVRGLYQWYLI
ncbi:Uncharacterized protein HZ326_31397 [Fusarium oxysporum f. sp. albedinis]|nr:Uncharacterized protein HZ326_31397 [Fusarium oxysporum f. sp. albedinis]